MGRPFRRTRARRAIGIFLIGSCLTIGACGGGGATGGAIPTPTQTSIPVYTLGKRAPTARGYVVVFAYDTNVPATATRKLAKTGDRFVAFDVKGCASVRDRASPVFSPAL